jgi:MoxR-like ATPase
MTAIREFHDALQQRIGEVVIGQQIVVRGLATALVAGGHVLIEGVPGIGKTLLAKTLAGLLGGQFKRVQCTADLMPSDMTGIHVWRADSQRFELMPGPLFADVVLVDEINRTGPKTQSALLEAMEERRITIDRESYALSDSFFVVAAQNPHEFEGTYPLPESQLDRFLLRLKVGYPQADTEIDVLRRYDGAGSGHRLAAPEPMPPELLAHARDSLAGIRVSEPIYRYAQSIAVATRNDERLGLGLSTRGALALMRSARVGAAIEGRPFVLPDDLKQIAPAVIAHRLQVQPEAALDGITAERVVAELLDRVPVPRERTETA